MECYLSLKQSTYQALKRHGRTLNAFTEWQSQYEKATYCMVSTVCYFGEGKLLR